MTFQSVCKVEDIAVGGTKAVRLGSDGILVYRLREGSQERFYATQSSCTHLFAPLAKGKIVDNCQIQCPFHRARFDVRTGAVVEWANFPPGVQLLNVLRGQKALRTYPVRVENGSVQIDA